MQHPDISSIESYSRRSLPPAGMLTLGDHIAACNSCRELLKAFALKGPASQDLRSILGEDATAHLSTQEIEVAANAPQKLSHDAQAHLAGCSDCSSELADLRRFYSPVVVMQPRQAAPRKSALPAWAAWSGLAAAVAFAVLMTQMHRKPAEAPADTVAELHDGGAAIRLDANGKLTGPANLPPEYSNLLVDSLRSHRLPGTVSDSVPPSEGLRSEGAENSKFDVISPRNEVTSALPAFSWNALPGAESYQVELYDAHFNLVEKSPRLHQLNWTPSKPLAADAKYRWAVTATTAKDIVQAPNPSSAEARFTVADSGTLNVIDKAEKQFSNTHLLLASLYAKAGMRTLARTQIDALRAENPGSKLAEDLSQSLAAGNQSSPSKAKPAQ